MRFAGVVLAGGRSKRMGRDKALVPVAGVAMAERVADALRGAGCDPVAAVGGDADRLAEAGLVTVPDLFPGEGPVGGIITAMRWHPHGPVVVVACDLPMLAPSDLLTLFDAAVDATEHRRPSDVDVIVASTGRIEPLCAVWFPGALDTMQAAFDGGERAVHRAIVGLRVVEVPTRLAAMTNVNEPGDIPAG